jgi:hypothetical protein
MLSRQRLYLFPLGWCVVVVPGTDTKLSHDSSDSAGEGLVFAKSSGYFKM